MAIGSMMKQSGRGMAIAAALVVAASFTTLKPAQAVDAGTAVGIGLGSFALGTALGSTANPYYNGYYYPNGGYYGAPAPGYYYPAAPAPAQRTCWDPYRRYYYYC
ncbi:MAG TPA: hypothetical protein VEK82_01695 [Stellaceae bacterium]|nr:hypothetical protein [Stellaceae bacterium]